LIGLNRFRPAVKKAMLFKQTLSSLIRAIGRLPGIRKVLYQPIVRATIQTWPGFQRLYGTGWDLLHPFDRFQGTDTSGFVASEDLPSSPFDSSRKHVYGGSQPSIIRSTLATLPSLESYTFVDLGCGKGRPLLVASEFPFRDLLGVELSPSLAADAKRNAAILQERYPARVPIRIEVGDASTFSFPSGNLVVFLYNPFGEEVITKVVAGIETALAAKNRNLFIVYYNPIYGACFDASRALTRYFAATLPYSEEERGFGPDAEDPVVIWQTGAAASPRPGADALIEITNPGTRAELRW
jgi:SAM-dependent methyltransferase